MNQQWRWIELPSTTPTWSALGDWPALEGLDAVLLNSYQSVSYFAGTNLLSQMVLPDRITFLLATRENAVIVTSDIEAHQARLQSGLEEVYSYVEFLQSPVDRLVEVLLEKGIDSCRLGYESRRMPAETFEALRGYLPRLRLVEVDDRIEAAQSVKPPAIRDALAWAARTTQEAIEASAEAAVAGGTERDIAAVVASGVVRAGGSPEFCFVGAGERALVGHPEPSLEPLREGELWRVDAGGRFNRSVMSDVARTGIVGEPSPRQVHTFAIVRAAQDAAFDAIAPGVPARVVYLAAATVFAANNLEWRVPHVGHGLGIGVHEQPILAPGNEAPLRMGMVLAVEPFLPIAQHREVYHTEDLVLVTESGHACLTTPQQQLLRAGTR